MNSIMTKDKSKGMSKRHSIANGYLRDEKKESSTAHELSREMEEIIKQRIADKFYERDDVLMEVASRILKNLNPNLSKRYN